MFQGASSFQRNLCLWQKHPAFETAQNSFPNNRGVRVTADNIFDGTKCNGGIAATPIPFFAPGDDGQSGGDADRQTNTGIFCCACNGDSIANSNTAAPGGCTLVA